jgi:hypothetical protein
LNLSSYLGSLTMTTTLPRIRLWPGGSGGDASVRSNGGGDIGSGGFLLLAALRDRISLRFHELIPTPMNLGPCDDVILIARRDRSHYP